MTSASTRRRLGAGLSAVAIAASLGAAGCGGGGDNSSSKDYASALNTFCKTVEDGSKQVQSDATSVQGSAAKDPKTAIKKLGGVLGTFADTIDGGLGKFKQADVPSKYQDFNKNATAGIADLVGKLRSAAKSASTGNVQAITTLGNTLDGVKLPDLPKDLTKNAPACSRISAS
jgi:hypothetical protein